MLVSVLISSIISIYIYLKEIYITWDLVIIIYPSVVYALLFVVLGLCWFWQLGF